MAISPNGKYLVSGGVEGLLKVWDPLDLVLIKNLFCSANSILCIDIDPESEYILCGNNYKMIFLWSLNSLKLRKCFEGHLSHIRTVKFLYSSKKFVSGSDDQTIKVWDTFKSCLILVLNLGFITNEILITKNINRNIVCVSSNKILKNKKVTSSIKKETSVICANIFEKGTEIAVGFINGMLEILSFKDLKLLKSRKAHFS